MNYVIWKEKIEAFWKQTFLRLHTPHLQAITLTQGLFAMKGAVVHRMDEDIEMKKIQEPRERKKTSDTI